MVTATPQQSDSNRILWSPQVRNTMTISDAVPPVPDSSLHIWTGSAGTVASRWTLGLTIEDDGAGSSTGIQFLGPTTANREIAWGGPTDGNYYHAISGYGSAHATVPATLAIRVAGVEQLRWTSGVLTFQLATTLSNVIAHRGTGAADVIQWANLAATDAAARRWRVQVLDPATDTFYDVAEAVPDGAVPKFTMAAPDDAPSTSELDDGHITFGYTKATDTLIMYVREGASVKTLVLGVAV